MRATLIRPPRPTYAHAVARLLALGLAIAAALGVVLAGRIGWVAYGPGAGPQTSAAQVRFLQHALDTGGAERMQRLFPEGSFFLRALTAAAETALPEPGTSTGPVRCGTVSMLPESVAVFGSGMVPEHGIFAAGWSLMVAVEVAEASGATGRCRGGRRRRAVVVEEALRGSRSGFLAGYPGQYWPCDTVVAAASSGRGGGALDRAGLAVDAVRAWREEVAGPSGAGAVRVSVCCRTGWMWTGAGAGGAAGCSAVDHPGPGRSHRLGAGRSGRLGAILGNNSARVFRGARGRPGGASGSIRLGTVGAGDVDSGPLPGSGCGWERERGDLGRRPGQRRLGGSPRT